MKTLSADPVDNRIDNRRASTDHPTNPPLHATLTDFQPPSSHKDRIRATLFIVVWLMCSGAVLWAFLEATS